LKKLHINKLFLLLGIQQPKDLKVIANKLEVNIDDLRYHNDNMIFPTGDLLYKILSFTGYSELELKLRLGIIDSCIVNWIANNPQVLLNEMGKNEIAATKQEIDPVFQTNLGSLYQSDCLDVMRTMESESIDLIFADPPFNLGKSYQSGIDDYLSEAEYLEWTESWLLECTRLLAPGGSLFIYNIPYWQTRIATILNKYLNFRHWIAIYMRGLIPVARKLNPSHYGLLYYIKGDKPKAFNQQRIPMTTCRHCGGEAFDYGGKKKDLNDKGLSIADVWTDIHPVRHKKFKTRDANELPLKLLHRVISLSSNEGDRVFDPFGGSGTTYIVAEHLNRRWIGSEIGDLEVIINRLENRDEEVARMKSFEKELNVLFTEQQRKLRKKHGFWLPETL